MAEQLLVSCNFFFFFSLVLIVAHSSCIAASLFFGRATEQTLLSFGVAQLCWIVAGRCFRVTLPYQHSRRKFSWHTSSFVSCTSALFSCVILHVYFQMVAGNIVAWEGALSPCSSSKSRTAPRVIEDWVTGRPRAINIQFSILLFISFYSVT